MKWLKHLWDAFVAWFDDDGISDIEMTPQQVAQLCDPGSLEGWE